MYWFIKYGLLLLSFAICCFGNSEGDSLFGIVDQIQKLDGTVSIILIICAVLLTEYGFESLHKLTHDTPFQDMLSSIEKELMIVGCMAFLFKIVVNVTRIESNWLLALEYSDLFIPLVSFCFCAQGLFLILLSIRQCAIWSKAFHLTLDEVLYDYYNRDEMQMQLMAEVQSTTIYHWINSFNTKAELEFKVFNEIFCDQFKIIRSQFQFDSYVERVYEKFLLDIITIRPLDWFIVVLLALLNYGRLELDIQYGGDCHHDDLTCTDAHSIKLFAILGTCVFSVSLLMAILSRIYERRLLSSRGVETMSDCIVFLRYAETQPKVSTRLRRLSADDLKNALAKIRINALQAKDHERIERMKRRSVVAILAPVVSPGKPSMDSNESVKSTASTRPDQNKIFPKPDPKNRNVYVGNSGVNSNHRFTAFSSKISYMAPRKLFGGDSRIFSVHGNNLRHLKGPTAWEGESSKQIGDDIVKIFWLSSPTIYFAMIMVQIMIISSHLALWVTNYLAIAMRMPNNRGYWVLVGALPSLLSIALSLYTVRCAALLKAVSALDKDIVEEILEDAEAAKNLSVSLRDKILSRLQGIDAPEVELKRLFEEIDVNNSKSLSRSEFQVFLHDLDITFSRKRWVQIFKQIDRNFDDEISSEELFLFIFPNHDEARTAELQRLKKIRKSVWAHATQQEKNIPPQHALGSVFAGNKDLDLSSQGGSAQSLIHHHVEGNTSTDSKTTEKITTPKAEIHFKSYDDEAFTAVENSTNISSENHHTVGSGSGVVAHLPPLADSAKRKIAADLPIVTHHPQFALSRSSFGSNCTSAKSVDPSSKSIVHDWHGGRSADYECDHEVPLFVIRGSSQEPILEKKSPVSSVSRQNSDDSANFNWLLADNSMADFGDRPCDAVVDMNPSYSGKLH